MLGRVRGLTQKHKNKSVGLRVRILGYYWLHYLSQNYPSRFTFAAVATASATVAVAAATTTATAAAFILSVTTESRRCMRIVQRSADGVDNIWLPIITGTQK